MLVTRIFSFSHNIFKRLLSQDFYKYDCAAKGEIQYLFQQGKVVQLIGYSTCDLQLTSYMISTRFYMLNLYQMPSRNFDPLKKCCMGRAYFPEISIDNEIFEICFSETILFFSLLRQYFHILCSHILSPTWTAQW